MFYKISVIKKSENLQENAYSRVSFDKLADLQTCNLIKNQLLTRVFSSELCNMFENTYFTKDPQVTGTLSSFHYSTSINCFVSNNLLVSFSIFQVVWIFLAKANFWALNWFLSTISQSLIQALFIVVCPVYFKLILALFKFQSFDISIKKLLLD